MTSDHGVPGDGRDFAPSAQRNREPILAVLRTVLPSRGLVLEIASGTGQHVVHFAAALPDLEWQPSEAAPARLPSIRGWIAHDGVANVRPPIVLDVLARPWPVRAADAMVAINVLHIAPWPVTVSLIEGAADVLPSGAALCFYGPFRRHGAHTAPSNAAFDADLRAKDPQWGVRDLEEVSAVARAAGFVEERIEAMPANNFTIVYRRA